jgi:D-alanine-D-alanine ligase
MSNIPILVDVIMGGPGGEAAVSRRSGAAIAASLQQLGYHVMTHDVQERLDIQRLRPGALIFNIIHGTYGEDGQLQTELERAGFHFVGSDAQVSQLCMNKAKTKERFQAHGLRVPWGVTLDLRQPFSPRDIKIPHHAGLVLKPASDGSSVGLKMIANPSFILPAIEEILRERGPVPYLLEERLPGPEYTVAVLEGENGPEALPPLHIASATGVFDFAAKYERADTSEIGVQDVELATRLKAIGLAAHKACGCRDISRCDIMRTADGELALLEINTLPGFTDQSLVPKAAALAGISFAGVVDRLIRRVAARAATSVRSHV